MSLKIIGKIRTNEVPSIEKLIKASLSAALFDVSDGEYNIEQGVKAVLEAFKNLNSPVALILRTPSDTQTQAVALTERLNFNYIWFTDPPAKPPSIPDVKLIATAKNPADLEALPYSCFFLESEVNLRPAGKQIFVKESKNIPACVDAMVFEEPRPQLFNKTAHNIPEDSPKAIIALTCEAAFIDKVTSFYHKIPVIAVAKRPIYEKLLLSLCCNYGVLPTAITKVPEDSGSEIDFARFVAELYGYQKGDSFIVTGSHLTDGNKNYTAIVTL